jgi:hypothetical protein
VQGSQDPALLVLTVDELKTNYLFGLDMSDDQGNPFPESLYEWYIKSAVSLAETQLDLPIRPSQVLRGTRTARSVPTGLQ